VSFNSREENKAQFQALMKQCRTNAALSDAIAKSVAGQYVLHEGDALDVPADHRFESKAAIVVSGKRTFEAAATYAQAGQKVSVLNFASATSPGGGVVNGATAQEESLCRCSTLYPCISEEKTVRAFHDRHKTALRSGRMNSLYNDDCIYTPGVVVCCADEVRPTMLPRSSWYQVDVISCAAPNLRIRPSRYSESGPRHAASAVSAAGEASAAGETSAAGAASAAGAISAASAASAASAVSIADSDLAALHEKRLRRILNLAKAEKADTIILGAFGCGAFRNPPQAVAAAMKRTIQDYLTDFDTIEFAVYCTPRSMENYDTFRQTFSDLA